MNLKEISYLTNLDSPLTQAKSLANHGRNYKRKLEKKNAREKTREKNEGKTLKMLFAQAALLLSIFTASLLFI
jgi:hypothetical protein